MTKSKTTTAQALPLGEGPTNEAQADALVSGEAEAPAMPGADIDAEAAALAAQEAEVAGPAVDAPLLQRLIAKIEQLNHPGHQAGLIDELITLYGMELVAVEFEGEPGSLSLQGVVVESLPPTCSEGEALALWCNAARRVLLGVAA